MNENLKKFKDLGLDEDTMKVVQEMGFEEPTEIQEKAIPVALKGKDVVGGSATGSGKTLAFGYPLIKTIEEGKGIQGLILAPTRELANQVSKALKNFGKHKNLNVVSIYGGVSIGPQIKQLRKADIVVGTPGRILDHLSRKTVDFSRVKCLVLDEADRMLDMGFLPDVRKIINKCSKERQTMLFSATVSGALAKIVKDNMKNPIQISVDSNVDPSKMKQVFYDVQGGQKFSLLVHLLEKEKSGLVLVFCNTKRNTDFIAKNLKNQNIPAKAFHGDLRQHSRTKVLDHFHNSEKLVLVCTDVAARGLDIKNVSHVYNYDCPRDAKDYIHRIGRTARAGAEGKVINIIGERDYNDFRKVFKIPSINIKEIKTPQYKRIRLIKPPRRKNNRGNRGYKGKNRSRGRNNRKGGGNRYNKKNRNRHKRR